MKTSYSLLSLLLIAPTLVQAQLLNVTNSQGELVNGTIVTLVGDPAEPLLTQGLTATINGSATVNVNMRRYELEVVPGTANYFCWGVCYDEVNAGVLPVWNAGQEGVISMSPGTAVNEFKAYLVPNGVSGTNAFRYVWFNTANGTDSIWVDVVFEVGAVGINERNASSATLDVFPNPATGADALVRYTVVGSGGQTQLVVYDVLGNLVHNAALPSHAGEVVLNTAILEPGLYFTVVRQSGRDLVTKRLVVAR